MTTARAIAPIATLPVFFKLGGRRVVVAGGTPPAVWKAELLAATGAEVLVLSAEPCEEMAALHDALGGRLRLERRDWAADDLAGAALAVGSFADEGGGIAFRQAAQAAGVPVNVVDVPSLCDFQFGTIVERSPLVIGISTDGAAPVLGQALRARIEALLPRAMGAWTMAAAEWRRSARELKLGFAARRAFWERFSEMALDGEDRDPGEADRQACMAAARQAETRHKGRVFLVGAGPGATGSITLQAVKALQSSDVIVHEAGLDPSILALGRREAKRLASGGDPVQRIRDAAGAGETVSWVGPGDAETCPIWKTRRGSLAALEIDPLTVRGLRCQTCPDGCAAPAQ